jgi:hypothetical protein
MVRLRCVGGNDGGKERRSDREIEGRREYHFLHRSLRPSFAPSLRRRLGRSLALPRRMSPHSAREAGPLIDHAAAGRAAAEICCGIFRRSVVFVVRQVGVGHEVELATPQLPIAGDAADCADSQVQSAGDFGMADAGGQEAADGGQINVCYSSHDEWLVLVARGEGEEWERRRAGERAMRVVRLLPLSLSPALPLFVNVVINSSRIVRRDLQTLSGGVSSWLL